MLTLRLLLLVVVTAASVPVVMAHCPLCTAAVGSAAVAARYFGVDASVIGVMVGGFAVSTGLWLGLKLKKWYFVALAVAASFALTVIPVMALVPDDFYFPLLVSGEPGSVLQRVYWLNKLLVGSFAGGIGALAAYAAHIRIKASRGKVLFPFQGTALTFASMLAVAGVVYLFTR